MIHTTNVPNVGLARLMLRVVESGGRWFESSRAYQFLQLPSLFSPRKTYNSVHGEFTVNLLYKNRFH